MAHCDFQVLSLLLNAGSKDVVKQACQDAATLYESPTIPDEVIKRISQQLSIDAAQTKQLVLNLGHLIHDAVFQGSSEPADILQLFPDNFHKDLKNLLGKVLIENLGHWRTLSVDNQVSLARLKEFDWRVDVKASSDVISRMSVPTCILNLQIDEQTGLTGANNGDTNSVNVELSKETLDTMLDALVKIREQLSSVAQH